MTLFTLKEKVNYKGHQMTVDTIYNNGEIADLSCEIIPFMPTHFMGVNCSEVTRN